MIFSFGQSKAERIEVDILGYERAPSADAEWLSTRFRVFAGGFHGQVDNATILTHELAAFLNQLRPLYKTLRGTAEFSTMEGQLHLLLVGDGKGHIELTGEVEDQVVGGNQLHFRLQFDQTQLATSIHELERVISEFPIRQV